MRWLGIASLAGVAYAGGMEADPSGWQTIMYRGAALTAHLYDDYQFKYELIPQAPPECISLLRGNPPLSFDAADILNITEAFQAVYSPYWIAHSFENVKNNKGFNVGGACTSHRSVAVPDTWVFLIETKNEYDGAWNRYVFPDGAQAETEAINCAMLSDIDVVGSPYLQDTLIVHACAPVSGGWTSYSYWSECSATCGGGTQTRTRTCTEPAPLYGGECDGDATATQSCNQEPCPVDGGWSEFIYSDCSSTCGEGTRMGSRTCTNPRPAYSGDDCVGDSMVTDSCDSGPCPVNGGWSEYIYSDCSATCGFGTQIGTRTCTNPRPAHDGDDCEGDSMVYDNCMGDAGPTCPDDGGDSESSNGISAVCNDDNTISVTINYDQDSSILSATYGSCNETDIRGADATGVQQWDLTLDPSSCGMESNLRNLVYNQTAEFTVGFKDGSTKLKLADFEVDTYCNYTSEYTVTFDYGPVNAQSFNFTDSGGLIGLNFYIASYSNSSFNVKANPSTMAGDTIYLKLALNATLNDDFDHAANMDAATGKVFVPTKCEVTDDHSNAYTLFDTAGGGKCKNDIISLSVTYNSGDPQSWYIQHVLFLLNNHSSSNYTLECDVLVCDAEQITRCKNAHDCLTA